MSDNYTDTILLECNRKSSPEYLSGGDSGNATWTNNAGTGISLDVGDTIEVESAYVSAIGNEASTIEIKGKSFPVIRSSSQVSVNSSFMEAVFEGETDLTSKKVGTFRWNASMGSVLHTLKDSEINLTQSYYKNTNAEFYCTLPRHAAVNGSFLNKWFPLGTNLDDVYQWPDGGVYMPADGGKLLLNNASTNSGPQANWYSYNSSQNGSVVAPNPFRLGTDYNAVNYDKPFIYPGNTGKRVTYTNLGLRHECINDGTRHTLFVRDKFSNNASDQDDGYLLNPLRDPALYEWIWYKDTNTYNVNVGFNSPQNVATQITNQMSDVTELQSLNVMRTADNEKSLRRINIEGKTRSMKRFPCATPEYFYHSSNVSTTGLNKINASMSPAICYLDPNNASLQYNYMDQTKWDDYLYGYDSMYATVGFKRPEIQETGRRIAPDPYSKSLSLKLAPYDVTKNASEQNIVYPSGSSTNGSWANVIPLALDWTEENLFSLKEYFDSQKLYPELFSYNDMSASQQTYAFDLTTFPNASNKINVEESRFLHMNAGNLDVNRVFIKNGTTLPAGTFKISCSDAVPASMKLGDKVADYSDLTAFDVDDPAVFVVALDRTANPQTITLNVSFKSAIEGDGDEYFDISQRVLGNDNYFTGSFTTEKECAAIFFDYDSKRSEQGSGGANVSELYYGFGLKFINSDQREQIALSVESFGIAEGFFNASKNIPLGLTDTVYSEGGQPERRINTETTREIGFDKHFNAYGTCAILLYNGDSNDSDPSYVSAVNTSAVPASEGSASAAIRYPRSLKVWQEREVLEGYEAADNAGTSDGFGRSVPDAAKRLSNPYPTQMSYNNQLYIGADDPVFSFDGEQSRFFFQRLHTAERVGNNYDTSADAPIADADLTVYKINKRLRFTNYSPNFIPYNRNELQYVPYGNASSEVIISLDKNIVPYSIMDSHSGIQFEDYGVSKKQWRNSLWELMGFTYEQFHSSLGNRNARVEPAGLTTQFATTNSEIRSADFVNFNKTGLGVTKFDPTGIATMRWTCQDTGATWPFSVSNTNTYMAAPNPKDMENGTLAYSGRWYGYADYPAIVQSCSSVKILAEKLPRKMISPIYLIKSDVISPEYVGGPEGSAKMPIVSVVPKNSGYGDFYNGIGTTVFTNTIPRTIQNITTSIMDADGTEARVDDASCVIYKITKEIGGTSQVINDILNPPKKK